MARVLIDIYCHINQITKMAYVGQSRRGIDARWKEHCHDARKRSSLHFARSISCYGEKAFTHVLLEQHENQEDANEAEDFFILYLNTLTPNGYNLKRGGSNGKLCEASQQNGAMKLKKRFEEDNEFRLRHRIATKIGSNKPKAKAKNIAQAKKRFENPEERRKNSEQTKKRFENPEERQKSSERATIANKKRYENDVNAYMRLCSICNHSGHNKRTCKL